MMKLRNLPVVLLLLFVSASVFAQKLTAEEVLAKHLDSIASKEKRAAVNSFIAVGNGAVKFLSGKNQTTQGRIVLASQGEKYFYGMGLSAVDYPSEKFSFDGKKSKVAFVRTGARSILGNFVLSNNLLLEESLLGGTLSTSWALLNLGSKNAKLSYDGTKKIEGKETYVLGYSTKKGGDLTISLYFDKETFRHIRTEYRRISSAAIGRTIDESARQIESRLKVVEDFSNFKDESGLTVPHGYKLLYSISGQNGTTEIEWAFDLTEFALNQKFDEKTFDAEAN